MVFSPLVDDIHFVWLLLPISIMLLTIFDLFKGVRELPLLVIGSLTVMYLSVPRLHDVIYKGYDLAVAGGLVDKQYLPLTGAYLYGFNHAIHSVYFYKKTQSIQ